MCQYETFLCNMNTFPAANRQGFFMEFMGIERYTYLSGVGDDNAK